MDFSLINPKIALLASLSVIGAMPGGGRLNEPHNFANGVMPIITAITWVKVSRVLGRPYLSNLTLPRA